MLVLLLLLGPYRELSGSAPLTSWGTTQCKPEYDLVLYVIGCLLTVALALGTTWLLQRSAGGAGSRVRTAVQIAIGVSGLGLFLTLLCQCFPLDRPNGPIVYSVPVRLPQHPGTLNMAVLLVAPLATLLGGILTHRRAAGRVTPQGSRPPHRRNADSVRAPIEPLGTKSAAARWGYLLDGVALLFLMSLLFIPPGSWSALAGRLFAVEKLHHWNFFAMDPAYSFTCAEALGTERYSQYGMGWPLTYALLARFTPLAYSTMIGVGMLWGCVYYVGAYVLLRLIVRGRALALAGALAALLLQMFHGLDATANIWNYPSSTCLRNPFDLAAFIAFCRFLQTRAYKWGLAAGVLAGLEALFITETGIYLVLVLGAALLAILWRARQAQDHAALRATLRAGLLGAVVGVVVLLVGLWIASRGTLWKREFWSGYLEALWAYPQHGLGMLPVAGVDGPGLLLFAAFCLVYLTVVAWVVIDIARGTSEPRTILLGTLSAYGILVLVLFVGRSHAYNLYHVAVPLALILAVLLDRSTEGLPGRLRRHLLWPALVAGLTIWLWFRPTFQGYPTLLHGGLAPPPAGSAYLLAEQRDVALPEQCRGAAAYTSDVADAIRQLTKDGARVAVLDDRLDIIIDRAAHIAPWGRYGALATMIITQTQLEREVNRLRNDAPAYVLLPPAQVQRWQPFVEALMGDYERSGAIGQLGVWKRR